MNLILVALSNIKSNIGGTVAIKFEPLLEYLVIGLKLYGRKSNIEVVVLCEITISVK